jgi:hypothetical protein
MKISELLKRLPDLPKETRGWHLRILMQMLSPPAQHKIKLLQDHWDGRRPYDEFRGTQDQIIREQVEIETSQESDLVRKSYGMPPLRIDHEVEELRADRKLRILEMYAFIVKDELGDEGVCGFYDKKNQQWTPMVGADLSMMEKLRPQALAVANAVNKPVQMVKFTTRIEVETIQP